MYLAIILYIISLGVILLNISNLLKAMNSIRFLRKYFTLTKNKISGENPYVIVLLPVLNEQKIIKSTTEYMRSFNYPKERRKIIIITTEKEKKKKNRENTVDIAEKLSKLHKDVDHIHYPLTVGCKADQINHAVDEIKNLYPSLDYGGTFIAIYDADSRPNPDSLHIFSQIYKKNRKANVFQQSASFENNYMEVKGKNSPFSGFLLAAGFEQTLYTLAYEIPKIIRKNKVRKNIIDRYTYAHVVGHGLFLRLSFAKKYPFPKNYYPEDMFYGFILDALEESIIPLPVLDSSDHPATLKEWFRQKSLWFKGPFNFLVYKRYVKKEINASRRFKDIGLDLLCISAWYAALGWFTKSILALILLLTILYADAFLARLAVIALISYVLPSLILAENFVFLLKVSGKIDTKISLIEPYFIAFLAIPYAFVHSLPTIYSAFFIKK